MFESTDDHLVEAAAALLPPDRRDVFLRSIANRFRELPSVKADDVLRLIARTLAHYGLSADLRPLSKRSPKGAPRSF